MASKVKMRIFRRSISAILAFVLVFTTVLSTLTIVSSAVAPTSYTDVTANSSVTVDITSGGTSEYFRFIPTESGSYTFYSSDTSSRDTYGALLDSYGNTIVSNDDSGGNYNFSITYDCVAGETYYIQALFYSGSTTGSYPLNIQANFTLSQPFSYTDVVANSTANVNITTANSAQYFRFIPTQSGSYTFYSSDSSYDTYGSLLDSYGEIIASDDDSAGNRNFSITYDCVAGQTYYIKAFFYDGSATGSYILNVRADYDPSSGVIITAGTNTYSLFNSGATESSGHYTSPNPAPSTHTNGGYDLYGKVSNAADSIFRLGLSFTVGTTITEQATLTVRAYDVDEDVRDCGSGYEYDYIYLVDETTGTSVKLDGHMSGTSNTWTTSSFRIDPYLLQEGHTYHFEFEITCTGSHSCGYYTVKVRSVALLVSGEGESPLTGINYANLEGAITSDGLVVTRLTATAYEFADYHIEYKAVCVSDNTQRGYEEIFATICETEYSYTAEFYLDSGSPRGTYIITAFIKNGSGNVVATRDVTVSYGYCAVSYNSNGGSQNLPVDVYNYSTGDIATVLFDYIPSRSGYTFLGWSRYYDAIEPEFTEYGVNTFEIGSGDVTLYAVWEEIEDPTETPSETPTETPSETPSETPPFGPVDVWDGSVDSVFGGGSGTESDPYLIYTASQLAYLAQSVSYGNSYYNMYFKLMSNLDLNNYEWTPIGPSENSQFRGHFDGNYRTISNMTITESHQFAGLFGVIDSASVKNLALKSVYIDTTFRTGYSAVGGLAGIANNSSSIYNCSVVGTVTAINNSTSYAVEVGGLVANIGSSTTITNCYTNVTVYGSTNGYNAYAGGLIGITDSNSSGRCVIENCYSVADITAITTASSKYAAAGGLVGDIWSRLEIVNSFALGNVYASSTYGSSYTGVILAHNDSLNISISNCYYGDSNGYNSYTGAYYTDNASFTSKDWVANNLGWDFEGVWTYDTTGYEFPVHRGFNSSAITCHQSNEWIYDVEPTCLTGGHRYKICTICGEMFDSEDVPALQHDFVITEESQASCTTDGYVIMTCQREGCGYSKHQIIYATGHNFGNDNICDECGYEIFIHEHEYTDLVVDATCTQMGYTIHVCECGHEYRDNFIDQRGHSWDEGTVETPKTCTTNGVMVHSCVNCNANYTVEIPAGHNWSETVTVNATCTTDGSITRTCEDCGVSETEIIPASHTWDEGVVILEATCTTAGSKTCTCMVCGESADIEIDVLGHTFVNGSCTRCGAGITDIVAPNTDHPEYGMYFEIDDILSNYGPEFINEYGVLLDYNEDANIKKVAVFLTQEGTMWRRCIACVGDNISYATYVPYLSYDETIHYTGLNSEWINIFRLSENSDGIWCYSNYTTIGVNLEDAYGNLLLSLYDIGQAGAKTRIFDDLDEMIAWLKEPDGCIYHTEGEWIVESEPSCGTEGLKYTYCTECGARIEEIIPAVGEHIVSEWIVDIEATAVSSGSRHKECLVCGTVMETDVIDILATLKIEDVIAKPGSTVSVTLDIQNNPGIIGAALTFEFDPALTLVDATSGGAWSLLTLTTPANYNSPCTFVWDGLNASDYSNGTIITLTFEVPAGVDIGTVYNISATYSFGNMINAEFENVDVHIECGSITVEELMGDVNDDGVVDVADVIALRRYMSSGYDVTINFDQTDMNDDGVITMADIILLRRYITNGTI